MTKKALQWRIFCSVIGLVFLSGCVSVPKLPEGAVVGEDYAQATFEFGLREYSAVGAPMTQVYTVGYSDKISQSEGIIAFSKTIFSSDSNPKEYVFRTNATVYIFAEMKITYGMYASGVNTCDNISYFTPEPFVRYQVVQNGYPSQFCSLEIIDADSGEVPSDLNRMTFDPPAKD